MKLEEQCCSLESARRLKELGVKQDSFFYWYKDGFGDYLLGNVNRAPMVKEDISAFTCSELGEMLPTSPSVPIKHVNQWMSVFKNHATYHDNEVEARAKMLIYLLEHNLISPQSGGEK